MYDVLIVGAGVIGGMLARELSKYQLAVCILEKENDVAMGASRANSGIVHGGYDPEPGTLKAKLNATGVDLLYEAAEQLHVPYKKNGSMVCAFSAEEEPVLNELYQRGLDNQIVGLELLDGDEARVMEPNLSPNVTKVLRITNAGIICPYELTVAAIGNAMDNGVTLYRNFEVTSIQKEQDAFIVHAASGERITGRYMVNCAGGYSDRIAQLAGDGFFSITPRAGEYMLLDKAEGSRIKHTIFQCPTPEGKGILVSPTVDGNLLVGPTATKVDSPNSRDTTSIGMAAVEFFAYKSVPSINFRQIITSFTGVRASEKNGEFILQASKCVPGLVHAGAIDSPGLTCCVSIAKYLTGILKAEGLVIIPKADWSPNRRNMHEFRQMDDEQKNTYIQEHPEFGKIVCRCERVTEGDILAAIRCNPGARDMDGIKRRTRSGMGRCQGGFCGPYVMEILSKEMNIPLECVTKCGGDSKMLFERIGD